MLPVEPGDFHICPRSGNVTEAHGSMLAARGAASDSKVRSRHSANVDFIGIMCGTTRHNVVNIIVITKTHRNTRRRQGGGPWVVINHL